MMVQIKFLLLVLNNLKVSFRNKGRKALEQNKMEKFNQDLLDKWEIKITKQVTKELYQEHLKRCKQ